MVKDKGESNDFLLNKLKLLIDSELNENQIVILPAMDVYDSVNLLKNLGYRATVTMLDPWYNKGVGGIREDYVEYIVGILNSTKDLSDHVYLWGFPEIVARFIERIPEPLKLVAWLTWYFKNSPSVIRGWRSSQMACLHLSHPKAKLYPEHFLNESQKVLLANKKLRYMPGPTSVIEGALLVGFVGKKEQTGHPAQKPVGVYEKLLSMVTEKDQLVIDPMSGSGTTGQVAINLGLKAILSDESEEYIKIMEKRLGLKRLPIRKKLRSF